MRTQPHILDDPATDPFEVAATAAAEIAEKTGVAQHDIALTLGSGWAKAADLIGETTATIPATEVTGFSKPALEGHVAVTVPVALLAIASRVAAAGNLESTAKNFARFGYALIPLDVAAHLAHNLFHLLAEGGSVYTTVAASSERTP